LLALFFASTVAANTKHGDISPEHLRGGGDGDSIYGSGGRDSLFGYGGNDRLYGGTGGDKLYGGSGSDLLDGFSGDDRMWGGGGNDEITSGAGHDRAWGGPGNDRISGEDAHDELYGGSGNDRLFGDTAFDTLIGGKGDDYLQGGSSKDKLIGGPGNDTINAVDPATAEAKGGLSDWEIDCGPGNDTLIMDRGDANLVGYDYRRRGRTPDIRNYTGPRYVPYIPPPASNLPPRAAISTPSYVYVGSLATLTASGSYDPDGFIANYAWDLDGDGVYEVNTGATFYVSRTFNLVGTVSVGIQVTDNRGASSVARGFINVLALPNRAPIASFTANPSTAVVGQVVSFDGRASSDPDGQSLTYDWDFGDGSPHAGGSTASHAYAAAGPRVVRLRVTDTLGVSNETTRSLTINPAGATGPTGPTGPAAPVAVTARRSAGDDSCEHKKLRDAKALDRREGHTKIGDDDDNRLVGSNKRDRILGGAGDDELLGLGGNDILWGDQEEGTTGDDKIDGGAGDDTIYGNLGNDKLSGGAGKDYINAGEGNDEVFGGPGTDKIVAWGQGVDTIDCGGGNDYVSAQRSIDHIRNCEHIRHGLQ
jgi:Ca2+-binding RTX toxin-like protein